MKRKLKPSTTDVPPPGLHPPSPSSTPISRTCHRPVSCPLVQRRPKMPRTAQHLLHRYVGNLLKRRFSQEERDGRGRCLPIRPGRGRAFTSHQPITTALETFRTLRTIILHLYPATRQCTSTATRTNPRSPSIPSLLPLRTDKCQVQLRDRNHRTISLPLHRRLNHSCLCDPRRAGLRPRTV